MKILRHLALPLLIRTSSLALVSHGMPQAGSTAGNDLSISKRHETRNYVVYPKNPTNEAQTTAIGTLLESVVSDPKHLSVHGGDLGVSFWSAVLTSDDAELVSADSTVSLPRIKGLVYS